jgi:hypothetical protein
VFSLAASCSFAALPAPPGPQLARPPLNRPCGLLLAQTRRAAARLSRRARRRPPAAACRPPARLFLAWERASKFFLSSIPSRAPAFLFLSPLDYFAEAPLSATVSRLRCTSSPISCSTSTATSHCPFLIRSSSSSRARSLERCASDLTLCRRSNSSRTKVPPLLLPRQEHHQHHISTPKLPNQFPSPSCTPVTGTPSPPSEPRHAGSVSSRTAASKLPFYNSNHSQVRYELLNFFLHLSLAAGEPPCQILIAAARLLLFKSITNASLYFILGSCLQNTCPSTTHPSATRSSTTHRSATPLSATFAEEKSQPMHTPIG